MVSGYLRILNNALSGVTDCYEFRSFARSYTTDFDPVFDRSSSVYKLLLPNALAIEL